MEALDTPRSQGEVSVDPSASSPYFKRRYDGKTTRREVLEHRFGKGKSPRPSARTGPGSSPATADMSGGPAMPVASALDGPSPKKKLLPKPAPICVRMGEEPSTAARDDIEIGIHDDEHDHNMSGKNTSLPQHASATKCYRVVFKGVVSLLMDPVQSSPRSGTYVSYGDILKGTEQTPGLSPPLSSPGTPGRIRTHWDDSTKTETNGKIVVCVHEVLTGGYIVDAVDVSGLATDKTPRRGNTYPNACVMDISTFGGGQEKVGDGDEGLPIEELGHSLGYLFLKQGRKQILEPIMDAPKCEHGEYLYKVVSSTPLHVRTGPLFGAPTTQGMLVPGTVHEVSLRVMEETCTFLRLSRRRGWVVDRKLVSRNVDESTKDIVVMKNVTEKEEISGSYLSAVSSAVTLATTPISAAQLRHRAPRRQRAIQREAVESSLPRRVPGPTQQVLSQSRSASFDNETHGNGSRDRSMMSPSSNVSLLSDDSSLEHSVLHRQPEGMTSDLSASRSIASVGYGHVPSFFLMRVNAPRGLKILDAPHFQVNSLIHGSHSGSSIITSPAKDDASSKSGNQSIFQTMSGGHHTTTMTSKIGNPAVFDCNTKARKLPRGSVFEASKRFEPSGTFRQGSGLIKLSDNSGWAIVPRREELDEQYRNYSGSVVGIKEGEASRAFDEVGNAILDDHLTPLYMRILPRGGVLVSLPSSSLFEDDATSPTSSSGGTSSVISIGNASSVVKSQDSDVASSVGSSFIDAIFRTPRRKDRDFHDAHSRKEYTNHNLPKAPAPEKIPFTNLLPCGTVVEVESWAKPQERDEKVEFARLRGGQGWIPRWLNGKPVTEIIPQPENRFGSFWFRVRDRQGIKVRQGPSKKAPSIRSDDGVYFRFECGEYLRASEIVTYFRQDTPYESYAKLYRNRHVHLYAGHSEFRPLSSLTTQAEWVQVFNGQELFLEECAVEPRIERHRQGWRYNVVLDARVVVRKGPSFDSESFGELLGGESVLVNERVSGSDGTVTWLRLKDGEGWVHNIDSQGDTLMIPHSIRHRNGQPGRPSKADRPEQEDIAYNAIIARLFHNNDIQHDSRASSQVRSRSRWT